jgi:hypothetical protein
MRWRLILEEFGPNIQHIPGVDNIVVADTLSRLPSANTDREDDSTAGESRTNKLFVTNGQATDDSFPLTLSTVLREQNKELNKQSSKLSEHLEDKESGYNKQVLDDVELIFYFKKKNCVPQCLCRRTLDWYHFYLNHPGGDRLASAKTLSEVCYWKGLLAHQAKQHAKWCTLCQTFKKRSNKRYGKLPPKDIGQLTPWHTVHVDLIGLYTKTVKKIQPGGTVTEVDLYLTCMAFIDPATGWFEITQVPYYDLDQVKVQNQEYIDKTSARISQLFNNMWLSRYPRPKQVVFHNGSEFKRDFIPLLKDFDIKPVLTSIKNPQATAPVERIHQVLGHMFLTKDLNSLIFDYIDPWGEILSSIAWAVRGLVFGRDMIFNISTVIDWRAITLHKQKQVDQDNLRENSRRVNYDYTEQDKVYIKPDGIYRKLDYKKKGPYTSPITQVHTNSTVQIDRGNANERGGVNIRRLEPYFED